MKGIPGVEMDVTFQPQLLRWARERAGLTDEGLAGELRVPLARVHAWEQTGKMRFSQAEKLAAVTRTPFGYLFLSEPPDDRLPITDFRTVGDASVRHPSPDLLETIQTMQLRQAWMRDFLIEDGETLLPFVRSATLQDQPRAVAAAMRKTLGVERGWAADVHTWSDALLLLREKIEAARILIVINGVVGNNNHRKLDPEEFRGFVLSDAIAPLIFVNGADAKAAQMFTFAHELAHLWLGVDGVSDLDPLQPQHAQRQPVEQFCNGVAAEFVVPEHELKEYWAGARKQNEPFQDLARHFKVSPIVAARRALDAGLISRKAFSDFYSTYVKDERHTRSARKGGGSFWLNQNVRIGKRFGVAVVRAAKEGRLLYQQAYQLTGLRGNTFDQFAKNLGY
ncbi:MAG: ImmA/IrrE family metallo-endopeptidase [Chloroflexi bacterium]|nr:ImmA/IrrE family metallo-endopeptidase [Chloroflexota bacterium]MBI3734096.1 ImmA/IrrE family metallo-endopeptidase [Chloroflexota bacterium]